MSEAKRESKGPLRGYFFDKSVVVTGASSGIGHDVALAFGEQGAQVALLARRRVQLEKLADKINKAGGKALALDCDVTDRARVFWAIEQAKEAFGKVDILINSAGLLISETVEQMRPEDLEKMMAVNVFGALHAMQAVLPVMRKAKSGNIVNISSLAGRRGVSPLGGYSSTKVCAGGNDGSPARRVVQYRDKSVARNARRDRHADGARCAQARFAQGRIHLMAMPARWVTWAVLAAAAFGLTEVDVPPGAAVAEKLASLFPGVTDAMLSVGTRIMRGAGSAHGRLGQAGAQSEAVTTVAILLHKVWLRQLVEFAVHQPHPHVECVRMLDGLAAYRLEPELFVHLVKRLNRICD